MHKLHMTRVVLVFDSCIQAQKSSFRAEDMLQTCNL